MIPEDLIKMLMEERISSVLTGNEDWHKEETVIRENLLAALDEETRLVFEAFAESLAFEEVRDFQCIYRAAFLDGLRLGHWAFG